MEQENKAEIAALWQSTKSAHKRLDTQESESADVAASIQKMAVSIESLAVQVKYSNDQQAQMHGSLREDIRRMEQMHKEDMEEFKAEFRAGQKAHGERIGALEKKPGHRWETVITQIISLVVAAAVGGIIAKLL